VVQHIGGPRVFVSSTIRDFSDLRSALKFWLEDMGFEAQMSEFNDFQRRPDQDTFASCLDAIGTCDYYVLLVGGRRGSWYEENMVSVTQQEYRVAMSLAKEGKIKPVLFARTTVLTALDERHAVGLVPQASGGGLAASSDVLKDPDFVQAFVDEIRRTQLGAVAPDGVPGTAWLYPFDGFRDIVEALRVNLGLHRSMRRQILLANLKWEVEGSIVELCGRAEGGLCPHFGWLSEIRSRIQLTNDILRRGLPLEHQDAVALCWFWVSIPPADRFRTLALRESILSGEFLEYRKESAELVSGPLYSAMQELLTRIETYRSIMDLIGARTGQRDRLFQAVAEQPGTVIEGYDLGLLYRLYDVMRDTLVLCVALGRYIRAPQSEFQMPELGPISPNVSEIARIHSERATREDIDQYLAQSAPGKPWA
jgi:hypothetical protein